MTRLIFIFFLNLLCGVVSAQQIYFSNTYDYYSSTNIAGAVSQTADSGYVVISSTLTSPNRGYTFGRLDKYGDTVYTRSYVYTNLYFQLGLTPTSIMNTGNGDYIVCGWVSGGTNAKDGIIGMFNSNGDTLWTKMYGDTADQDFSVIIPAPSGYWIGGSTTTGNNGNSDFWIVKVDSNFNTVWDTTYSTAQNDAIICGSSTWDGGLIFSGRSASIPFVVKTDSLGQALWEIVYSGFAGYGYVCQAEDSGYYVACGKTISGQDDDACLLKVDSAGAIQWYKCYGDTNRSEGFSCQPVLSNGTITVGGVSRLFSGYYDGYIVQSDLTGDMIWQRRYFKSSNGHHLIYELEPTFDGGYIASGACVLATQDAWVFKLDSLGCDSVGCDGVGFSEKITSLRIYLYPNPASEYVTISLPDSPLQNSSIEVYSFDGRLIDNAPLNSNSLQLNTSEYPTGIYFVRVIQDGECLAPEKLMIVR